jgi:hopanoid biosynthesis associated RND transporter like protein HpnN
MSSQDSMRYRVLRSLATLVYKFAWPILLLSIFLAVGSLYIGFHGSDLLHIKKLEFSGNPNDLLRSDASYHQKYLEYTKEFRAEEDYAIVIEGEDFDKNKECVEFIVAELKKNPDLFQNIFYKIDLGDLAKERGLLFLEIPQLKDIQKQISQFTTLLGKDKFTLDLNSLLSVASMQFDQKNMRAADKNPEAGASLDAFAQEFVSSLTALADRLEGKTAPKAAKFGNFMAENSELGKLKKEAALHEYISFEEGKILIIDVPSPNKEASMGNHAYAIKPMREAIQKARAAFPDIEIGLTGEPALSEDQDYATTHDSTISSIATFVLITLLFFISFREFTRPILALITLVLAVFCTIGFATITVGHFNILSMAFIPMILGLGIDFGIQILGRYEEELPKGDLIDSIVHTIMHTGNAILTGASTTAAAFYTMCFNDFKGLAEMGLIGGTGIVFCVLGNLILLPALLTLRDRKRSDFKKVNKIYSSGEKNRFDRIVLDQAPGIILLAVIATILAATQIPKITFDYNLLNLQNANFESVRFEHKLLHSKDSHSVIFAADVCDDLKQAAEHAEKFKQLPSVSDAVSITEIVPKDQEAKLKIIKQIKSKLENIDLPKSGVNVNVAENIQVLQTLRTNCDKMNKLAQTWAASDQKKEAAEFFGKLISVMDRCLKVLGSMSQKDAEAILTSYQTQIFGELRKNLEELKGQKVDRPITEKDVPSSLRNRYIGKTGKILIEVYPKEDIWDREPLVKFVKDIRKVSPDITGTPVQNYEYVELLKESFQKAGIYALVTIVVLIVIHFITSLKYVIPTLLPLALAIVWTAGLMPIVHLQFNPANIMTLPLVIGIGVAFGVYAVDRYRENKSAALFSTSTGKAIFLSALATSFGFGSLAFATDPSLQSLGRLMTIGVVMCLITSLYVCPAFLHLFGQKKQK